ncbi:polysaccharide deacetylase family protein [Paenibacillus sp. GCM10027628]|uniref:polysaccharide deacetylase family protein n=1 Tax=Paenibacillus sp. GCM10027628 TaxID=3273413 RepID=UPI003643E526
MKQLRKLTVLLLLVIFTSLLIAADTPQSEVSLPVLNYHSIGIEPGNPYVLHPDAFARQMKYLAAHHYTPISLSDFALMLEKKKVVPRRPVLLTFDDGYVDNYELALPLLRQYGFPAAVFVLPGNIGHENYLSWPQIKEMLAAGWEVQPHSMTHPHLPQLTAAQQREEITESRRQIEAQLGTTADIFAYPYGEYNEETLAILKEAGFRYSFTTKPGWAASSQNRYELHRIVVRGVDSFRTWVRQIKHNVT